jgi:hypothetical protein
MLAPMNARYLMTAWRVLILLLLGSMVGELAVVNRRLDKVRQALPEQSDTSAIEEKLDQLHSDLEDRGEFFPSRDMFLADRYLE